MPKGFIIHINYQHCNRVKAHFHVLLNADFSSCTLLLLQAIIKLKSITILSIYKIQTKHSTKFSVFSHNSDTIKCHPFPPIKTSKKIALFNLVPQLNFMQFQGLNLCTAKVKINPKFKANRKKSEPTK